MNEMRVWTLAALVLTSSVAAGQTTGGLRVTISLPDAAQAAVPLAKHALLVSGNPPTTSPKRVLSDANGVVLLSLPPGSYIVESDRPVGAGGQAYQWTEIVTVVAGRETTLSLTATNAAVLPLSAAAPEAGLAPSASDRSARVLKWQSSVVTVWSPTSQASGFVVDGAGLIATDRHRIGAATSVEVQPSPTVKVPARVLVADPTQDLAIVWVDPGVLTEAAPIPLPCPPATPGPLDDGDEIVALTASASGRGRLVTSAITGFHPRGIDTDFRLAFGDAGGPVFTEADATVVGLTSVSSDGDNARRGDVRVVRAAILCESLAAARTKMASETPPAPTRLPLEPTRAFPTEAAASAPPAGGESTIVTSSDFEIAFITPPAVTAARARADRSGGRRPRSLEAEARLGRLTDFGALADYFSDDPVVVVVRVSPKLVEGFWMRVAREAARTQGAVLPAFKDFKSSFLRLRATCGGAEVVPIHPFVLEHAVDDKRVVREGLYVFGPDAFGPHCATVTLTITSDAAPEKSETTTIDPALVAQIWRDFAVFRAAGP